MSEPGAEDAYLDLQSGTAEYHYRGHVVVLRLESRDQSRFRNQYEGTLTMDDARQLWLDLGFCLGEIGHEGYPATPDTRAMHVWSTGGC